MNIQILTAATATNGVPTLASDGFALSTTAATVTVMGNRGLLLVKSTAGSGVMTVTIRMWGYSAVTAAWHPLGVGTDAGKGIINGGVALGETSADAIRHAENIEGLENLERVYAEITAIGGTATAISAWLVARR